MPSATYLFCACLRLVSPLSPPPPPPSSPSVPASFLPSIDIIAKLFGFCSFFFVWFWYKKEIGNEWKEDEEDEKQPQSAYAICATNMRLLRIASTQCKHTTKYTYFLELCLRVETFIQLMWPSFVVKFVAFATNSLKTSCLIFDDVLFFVLFLFWVLRAFTVHYI